MSKAGERFHKQRIQERLGGYVGQLYWFWANKYAKLMNREAGLIMVTKLIPRKGTWNIEYEFLTPTFGSMRYIIRSDHFEQSLKEGMFERVDYDR